MTANCPRKFSLSQGKYIGVYTLSVTYHFCGLWPFACSDLSCLSGWHAVSCDTWHRLLVNQHRTILSFYLSRTTICSTSPIRQRPLRRGTGLSNVQGQPKTKVLHARGNWFLRAKVRQRKKTSTQGHRTDQRPRSDKDQSPPRQEHRTDQRPRSDKD